jgi:hypothetical protein
MQALVDNDVRAATDDDLVGAREGLSLTLEAFAPVLRF